MTQKIILESLPYYLESPFLPGEPRSQEEADYLNWLRADMIRRAAIKRLERRRTNIQTSDIVADLELAWKLPTPSEPPISLQEQEIESLRREHELPPGPLPGPLQAELRRRLELRRQVALKQLAEVL